MENLGWEMLQCAKQELLIEAKANIISKILS